MNITLNMKFQHKIPILDSPTPIYDITSGHAEHAKSRMIYSPPPQSVPYLSRLGYKPTPP